MRRDIDIDIIAVSTDSHISLLNKANRFFLLQ
jgi:hypothetical protein